MTAAEERMRECSWRENPYCSNFRRRSNRAMISLAASDACTVHHRTHAHVHLHAITLVRRRRRRRRWENNAPLCLGVMQAGDGSAARARVRSVCRPHQHHHIRDLCACRSTDELVNGRRRRNKIARRTQVDFEDCSLFRCTRRTKKLKSEREGRGGVRDER